MPLQELGVQGIDGLSIHTLLGSAQRVRIGPHDPVANRIPCTANNTTIVDHCSQKWYSFVLHATFSDGG